jgi:hypothetical protein
MQKRLAKQMVFLFLFVAWAGEALTEDKDLVLRIDAAFESAEKARTETAAKIKENADRRQQELEKRLEEVKKWTSAQFELGERGVIDKPKVMTDLMKSWQKAHSREIYLFLQFPEKSYGAIESGRALNSLLARVGPAAQQNQQTRRVNAASALPLHASSANEKISEETFNRLTIQDKVLGARDSRRGNGDPIDVDWPAVLREERWTKHCTTIEKARARVLAEMSRTEGISPEADQELRDAVGALNKDYAEYRKHWRDDKDYTHEEAAMEFSRMYAGYGHIRKLIASVYFVVQAKSFAQLPQREDWHGGNIEEFLSYMVRNNLQFGSPSDNANRGAYHEVFNLMVRYYLDETAMTRLQRQLEQEIGQQKKISREATDVALGKVMSENMRAAQNIAEMKFIRELIKD